MEDAAGSHARARVGSVLDGKWTLETLLGVGGMAAVYAARHRNGARAAVKLLHADLARHADVRERFRREGYAANRVEHPGAVRVLDDDIVTTGVDAGTAYLVMELLEGESMQDRVERAPMMDELEFLHIASAVLDVLKAAHARGVVHRDLKPENIFLVAAEKAASAGARVKVLDFGLARLLDGQAITTYGLALGTPSFMSPEQAGGRIDEIDGRTDLFALAATGFRLRAGRRIHEARNPVDLVSKMASLPAPRLREVAGDVSDAYARVIDRALEFRRDDRYESAAAMKDDVERALAELDPSVATTQLAIPPAPPSRASPPPPDRRARRRARSILPWVALLLFGGDRRGALAERSRPLGASTRAATRGRRGDRLGLPFRSVRRGPVRGRRAAWVLERGGFDARRRSGRRVAAGQRRAPRGAGARGRDLGAIAGSRQTRADRAQATDSQEGERRGALNGFSNEAVTAEETRRIRARDSAWVWKECAGGR